MARPEHGPTVVTLITDATVELNTLVLGTGTAYVIDEPGISGLGVPPTKTADTPLDGQDGSSGAPDFLDVRTLTIPLIINGTDAGDAFTLLAALNTAWAPAEDSVDLELTLTLPSWDPFVVVGRPRGVDVDMTEMGAGVMRALCRFDGLNPNFQSP